MRRRIRSLNPTEQALWSEVARSVRPLPGRPAPEIPAAPETQKPPEAAVAAIAAAVSGAAAKPPAPPPLVELDRRQRTQLRRGRIEIETAIDLHGLRQDEAHLALRGFLYRAQARNARLVLVVTGKGAAGAGGFGEERGVLKRMVPHWLRLPDLRPLVLGFEEAQQRHGGAGALYVRLRRLREPGP